MIRALRQSMAMTWLHHDRAPSPDPFLRDTFPYRLPPITWFRDEAVPLSPPDAVWITDTTFRDGQQSRAPYTPSQIAHLYGLLSRLGGPHGMIRQSELFLYTKKDR